MNTNEHFQFYLRWGLCSLYFGEHLTVFVLGKTL